MRTSPLPPVGLLKMGPSGTGQARQRLPRGVKSGSPVRLGAGGGRAGGGGVLGVHPGAGPVLRLEAHPGGRARRAREARTRETGVERFAKIHSNREGVPPVLSHKR